VPARRRAAGPEAGAQRADAGRHGLSALGMFLSARLRSTEDECLTVEAQLYPDRSEFAALFSRFLVLSVLSTIIASLGLLLDSPAAVIGAMLLGPFMTPLLGLSLAIVQGRVRRLTVSAAVAASGVMVSSTMSWLIGLAIGRPAVVGGLPGQLDVLTRPGLLDLGIALAAGVAAGYATVRRSASEALPGVAVSVTLEPPLAAFGLLLALGEGAAAEQAALNFATNLGAIVLAAACTLAVLGLHHSDDAGRRRRSRVGMATAAAVVLAVAAPLTARTVQAVQDDRLAEDTVRAVQDWDPSVEVTRLDAEVSGGVARIVIDASGPGEPEAPWRLAEALSRQRGQRVEVDVRFTRVQERRGVAAG